VVFRGNRGNELGTVFRTPNSQRGRSTFRRCRFEANHAGDGGGAIWMQDMALAVTQTAIVGNTSDGLGAGIRLDQGPHGSTLRLENTTLQGNVATESLGGGLVFSGTGTVRNCTFADNRADGGVGYFGAAIVAHGPESANLEVTNTIFSNNLDDHEWTPMTCSIGNAGDPSTLAGDRNVQWPRLRNGPNEQLDNPCTDGVVFEDPRLGRLHGESSFDYGFRLHLIGRELSHEDELTAFNKQSKLAFAHADDAVVGPLPRRGESALLESLLQDAQPGAIPPKNLGPIAGAIHEEEHVAGRGVASDLFFDDAGEGVEGLAEVGRLGRREDLPATSAQHRSISTS
jgi:hypothetical protein